jgi:hypothetical protein
MVNQKNIPAFPEDRDKFKEIAAAKKVSMKDLFHEIVVAYPTWPVVDHPEEASGLK